MRVVRKRQIWICTLYYAEQCVKRGAYALQENFSSLWDIKNQGNSEAVFAVQFTTEPMFNGDGNKQHLYWLSWYEDQPGMLRDIENGRPYRRHVATKENDGRFIRSFA